MQCLSRSYSKVHPLSTKQETKFGWILVRHHEYGSTFTDHKKLLNTHYELMGVL